MKAEPLQLVLDSLIWIHPLSDQIAKSFYTHLFEIAPHTKKTLHRRYGATGYDVDDQPQSGSDGAE